MALHYLNQTYQPGLVFQQLEKINYKMVVGIDVGHGECMAYVYRKKDNTWEPEPLYVNSDYETKIPSYIAYDATGNPIIGKGVSNVSGFYVYFKQEPSKWDKNQDDGAPNYKQLMGDYISVLWNNIWTYNDDIFQNVVNPVTKDDILLVIGCPASGSWTEPDHMKKYVELTKEATGCKNVMILAESTAAIMTPIYAQKVVNLNHGVAIYDFGSSTLDFTYILMGRVLLTASIPLGGSDVDRAMLRYILRENGTDAQNIDQQSKNACYTKLRTLKETFYNTNQMDLTEEDLVINRKLHYYLSDEVLEVLLTKMEVSFEGKELKQIFDYFDDTEEERANEIMLGLILQHHELMDLQLSTKKRKEIYKELSIARSDYLKYEVSGQYSISVVERIPYTVDKEMMQFVIEKDKTVSMNKLDASYGYKDKSWKDCVEQFFENTKNSIGTNPCGTVILTGGTSRITDVHQIARVKYGDQVTIHAEPNPSSTVAKGLCLAKGHEVSAAEKIEQAKKNLNEKTRGYFPAFCEGFGKGKLFDYVWAGLIRSLNELQREMKNDVSEITTYSELKHAIETKLSNDVHLQTAVKKEFTAYVADYMDPKKWDNRKKPHCTELTRDKANELALDIYGTQATMVPQISVNMITSLAGGIDDAVLLRIVQETSLARVAQKIVVDHMYTDQKVLGGLKRFAKKISLTFDSKITLLDVMDMHATLMGVANKEKYRQALGYQFGWGLQHSDAFQGIFEDLINQQFEVAVGIILFQVFDN